MHSTIMWPMNGKYVCPHCLREYAVDWPAAPAHPTLTSNFGVRTASGMPVSIPEPRPAAPAIAPEETLLRRPLSVARAAAPRVEAPAPAAAGIYVGGLGQRAQPVPFF